MNTEPTTDRPSELDVMRVVNDQLEKLDEEARNRTLSWLLSKFGAPQASSIRQRRVDDLQGAVGGDESGLHPEKMSEFSGFAELFAAAGPQTQTEKVLVGGYWLQVCEGAETFGSQSLNDQLKHLGEGVGNVTQALEGLKNARPALVLQIKKAGKAKQSRKIYKLTVPGVQLVKSMISRTAEE